MTEVVATEVAVGDQVRVHFHSPCSLRSFCEGVVSRVDVITPEGRFFAVEVTREVILDRKHNISGFEDYVRYECRNDFPGRIEVLPTAEHDVMSEPAPISVAAELSEEVVQEADEQYLVELEVHSEPETVRIPEAETNSEPARVDGEPQPVRRQGGLLAALFGRRR
jgi:hypothetical protein